MTLALRSCVRGVGAALPARAVANDELARTIDTSDEWIQQRTGIKQRYIAGEGETTSTLATAAATAALKAAGLAPADIDLVIVATSTPDYTFPAVATQVQANLGVVEGAAFDLQAVCTGFVYAVTTADKFLRSGSHKRALIIGAETFSRILDWTDRTTCVLFGDGAGAIVLEAQESDGALTSPGVIASRLRADGRHRSKLYVDGGPSSTKTVGIIIASADKLGIPREKVVITVDRHGNTSAASIPLALAVAVADGRIKPGDLVMIEAMGGGFTWGAALIRW